MNAALLLVGWDPDERERAVVGLRRWNPDVPVLHASNLGEAEQILARRPVCLAAADCGHDSARERQQVAALLEHYPDVPVLVTVPPGSPGAAAWPGTLACLSKPVPIRDLAGWVMEARAREARGGQLHGVSPGVFLQVVKLEQKTCTVRLRNRATDAHGTLFFRDGRLVDARVASSRGEPAAYRLLAWAEVDMALENGCPPVPRRIEADLEAVLMEALRQQDEAGVAQAADSEAPPASPLETLRAALEPLGGVENVYQDPSWGPLLGTLQQLGEALGAGPLEVGYLARGGASEVVLVPGAPPTLVSVHPRCQRDAILRTLRDAGAEAISSDIPAVGLGTP